MCLLYYNRVNSSNIHIERRSAMLQNLYIEFLLLIYLYIYKDR